MKTFRILFSLSFLSLSLFADSNASVTTQQSVSATDWKRYDDTDHGFSLKVPPDWQVIPAAGLDFLAFLPGTDNHPYPKRIAVSSEKLKVELGLEDFVKINLEDLKRRNNDFHTLSIKDAKVGMIPAKRIVYPAFDKDNNLAIMVLQYFFVWDNTAYVLTGISDKTQFQGDEGVFDQIVTTFHPTSAKGS